jgi:hypothetical protein
MPTKVRHHFPSAAALAPLLALAIATAPTGMAAAQAPPPAATRTLPDRLSDAEFWKLVSDFSEPNQPFRLEDNFTSNEMQVGQIFGLLRSGHVSGDVYLGVGPEQNFTYIAAVRPRMAFIVDIRRQAVMHHLMYKAIFEMSKDRGDFISMLFGKPRPAGLDSATGIQKMWEAYAIVPRDSVLSARNYARIVERLTKTHGFTFTADESTKLKWVFDAFQMYGPEITTSSGSNQRGGGGRSFAELTGYSADATGEPRSFLSSEDNYQYIKSLHEKNLFVAVSGDFGGTKALRAVGAYLKEHGATVRAYYVSNVEQYLFQERKDRTFYDNVATLPVDSASVFIRPGSFGGRGAFSPPRPLCPIAAFLRGVAGGLVYGNAQAVACVSPPPSP